MNFSNPIKDLNQAINRNDIFTVQKIIKRNPGLMNDDWKFSPLLKMEKSEKVVEFLIKLGFHVKCKKFLKTAFEESNAKCIELLLKNGVSLKGLHWERQSPPELVFSRNAGDRKEILQLLFKYGLDAHYRNYREENLLHLFVNNVEEDDFDAVEIAEILLNAGVPLDELDFFQNSALIKSIQTENMDLISFLIKKGSNVEKEEPLIEAAAYDNVHVVELFLSSGANMHVKTFSGWTVMHQACISNHEKIISLLIQKGADLSPEDDEGETPFFQIQSSGEDEDTRVKCTIVMVKEFSKLNFENKVVSQKDMDYIRANPWIQHHFESCANELFQMANTEFYAPCSFYSLLNRCMAIKKLANFTKNENLVSRFEENLLSFSYFKNDLRIFWDEAIQVRNSTEEIYIRLYSIFRDILPEDVLRKIGENLTLQDLPAE